MVIGFRLLAHGVVASGSLQLFVELLAALGGSTMLVAVGGLGLLAIRRGRALPEVTA